MKRGAGAWAGSERGQASLELLAALPLLLVIALAGAQLLAVGYSSVLAGNAAEAGALALAGGGGSSSALVGAGALAADAGSPARDAEAAVRAALPGWSRAHARVSVTGGHVKVTLRPPTLLRSLTGELHVRADASVEAP